MGGGLLLAAGLAVAQASARPAVAIVVVGSDPDQAGALQEELDAGLLTPSSVQYRRSNELAGLLGAAGRPVTSPDPATEASATALLEQAKKDYFEDHLPRAIESLARLASLEERDGRFPLRERIRLHLWKASVYLALDDQAEATREATDALTLAPDQVVDLGEFRPRLRELLVGTRSRLKAVTLSLAGLPPDAVIRVDGVVVDLPVRVLAGSHTLAVWAPGRREAIRALDLQADHRLALHLPLSLPAAADRALAEVLDRGALDPGRRGEIGAALRPFGVGTWILAVGADSRKVALIGSGSLFASFAIPAGAKAARALSSWLDQELEAFQSGGGSQRLVVEAQGGLEGSAWSRQISGGSSYGASFFGVGPAVTMDLHRGRWEARLEADYLQFGLPTVQVTLPDNSGESAGGGAAVDVSVLGGWRGAWAEARAGVAYRSRLLRDVTAPDGSPYGLLTSITSTGVLLEAEARRPINLFSRECELGAFAALEPWALVSESPGGSTGSGPRLVYDASLGARLIWRTRSQWKLGASYLFGARQIDFQGSGTARVVPSLNNAVLSEYQQTVQLTVRRDL